MDGGKIGGKPIATARTARTVAMAMPPPVPPLKRLIKLHKMEPGGTVAAVANHGPDEDIPEPWSTEL